MAKLLVFEPERDRVQQVVEATVVATSRISYVECHAALARASREGRLRPRDEAEAARRLDERWSDLIVVELDDALARAAAGLARDLGLRAAGAIQLASARALATEPTEVTFACWDRRLWGAARALGFALVPETMP